MQVDSHFYVTYILCRWAGLDHSKAHRVAHSSQYVDDNTLFKLIKFSDSSIYKPECTAHDVIDIDQLNSYDNAEVLVPYHFYPNSESGKTVFFDSNTSLKSLVFNESVPNNIDPYIYLGILLHVVADSYSHQEFYGFRTNDNQVTANTSKIKGRLSAFYSKFRMIFSRSLPIGHAAALEFPDVPGLKWSYIRDNKTFIVDNEYIFLQAYKSMYSVILFFIKNILKERCNREKDTDYISIMLSVMLEDFAEKYRSEEYRCTRWKEFIKGDFSQEVKYDKNAWIDLAFTSTKTSFLDKILFKPVFDYVRCSYKDCRLSFINSDWYKFQECAKHYRSMFMKYNNFL